MVAIYQGNPSAFQNNINVLRSGSTLRIPQSSEVSAVSTAAASAEVARQYESWRGGQLDGTTAPTPTDTGRLRLVTPEQGTAAPSTTTAVPPAAASASASACDECRCPRQAARGRAGRGTPPAGGAQRRACDAAGRRGTGSPANGCRRRGNHTRCRRARGHRSDARSRTCGRASANPRGAGSKTARSRPNRRRVEPEAPSLLERAMEYWWLLLALVAALAGAWLFQRLRRERGAAEADLEDALGRDMRSAASRTPRCAPAARWRHRRRRKARQRWPPAGTRPCRRCRGAGRACAGAGTQARDGRRHALGRRSGQPGVGRPAGRSRLPHGLWSLRPGRRPRATRHEARAEASRSQVEVARDLFRLGQQGSFPAARRRDERHARGSTRRRVGQDHDHGQADRAQRHDVHRRGAQLRRGARSGTERRDPRARHRPDGRRGIRRPTSTSARRKFRARTAPGIDFILDEPVRGADDDDSSVGPTVETPQVRRGEGDTAELPVDSLGGRR